MCSFSGQGFGQILYTNVEAYHFCSSCYPTTHFPITQSTSNIVLCHSRPPKLHVVLAGPLTQGHELSNLTHYTLSFKGSFCLFGVPHPCLQIVCVCVPDFIIFTSKKVHLMKLVSAIPKSSEAGTSQCSLKRHFNFVGVFICIGNAYLRF